MSLTAYYEYLPVDGAELFTMICKPSENGTFPTAILRSPYVDHAETVAVALNDAVYGRSTGALTDLADVCADLFAFDD